VCGPPPLACARGTSPVSARPQSTAILAIDEVHFVWMLFVMVHPSLSTDRFGRSDYHVHRAEAHRLHGSPWPCHPQCVDLAQHWSKITHPTLRRVEKLILPSDHFDKYSLTVCQDRRENLTLRRRALRLPGQLAPAKQGP